MSSKIPASFLLKACLTLFMVALLLAITSADVYDPTLFHQLYPVDGLQNWLSLPGALIGGTLVELWGSASVLIPLLALYTLFSPKVRSYWRMFWSEQLLILTLLSVNQFFWVKDVIYSQRELFWLNHSGYLGMILAQWTVSWMGQVNGKILLGIVALIGVARLLFLLPLKSIASGVFVAVYFPVMLVFQAFGLIYSWGINFSGRIIELVRLRQSLKPNSPDNLSLNRDWHDLEKTQETLAQVEHAKVAAEDPLILKRVALRKQVFSKNGLTSMDLNP